MTAKNPTKDPSNDVGKDPGKSPRAKIVVEDVRQSFDTDKGPLEVVGGISLSIRDGEFVAIVGPSGCGKTTLMNILAGFERPRQGRVCIDGVPIDGPSSKGIVISQQGSVFPWLTVQQNLMFGLDGRGDKKALADHYAAMVGLKGFESAYPHELSGGMLKRVEIARALVVKPEILYMDEPLSALDALTNLRVRLEILRILSEERHTVLLITHDVEEAVHMADRIVVLSARPTTIHTVFEVPFAHPRNLSAPELVELKNSVLRAGPLSGQDPAAGLAQPLTNAHGREQSARVEERLAATGLGGFPIDPDTAVGDASVR